MEALPPGLDNLRACSDLLELAATSFLVSTALLCSSVPTALVTVGCFLELAWALPYRQKEMQHRNLGYQA